MTASDTGFHRCNGVTLHTRRLGGGGKPTLVFVNSLGTDSRIWNGVASRLLDRYAVLLYDKRDHGLSDAPSGPYSIGDHAADLLALLDAWKIRRVALVGLSVGGMVAQVIAADHPDRVAALVLCDTASKIGDAATWNARIDAVEQGGLEAIADVVMDRWFTPTYRAAMPVDLRGWRNMLTRQPADGYAATCAAIRDADLALKASTIRTPTLCVVGDQDLSTPPDLVRATAARITGARFETITGSGHIPCIEQPGVLAELIDRHLAEWSFL